MRILPTLGVLALSAAVWMSPAPARADIDIYVDLAPPKARYERPGVPRAGYVWVAGHHEWRNGRYVWRPGYYERVRPGRHYVQPRWVRDGARWHYRAGGWRDRDRDGRNDRWEDDRGRVHDRPRRH